MMKVCYGSRIAWWYQKFLSCGSQFLKRHMLLDYLSIYPGSNKMYHDLKQRFWWTKMKIEIARYLSKGESYTFEVSWRVTAITYSSLEVGEY